ncbi:MAG: peptide chain release factor N(5)-glutamine methyltransferase [Bacillota bacterium]
MNIKELLASTESFFEKHDIPNPRLDAEVLLADLLGMDRIDLYVKFDYPLRQQELDRFRERVKRRAYREPVAYIIGQTEFMSLEFRVNNRVLLPRPETETLVERVLEICELQQWDQPNIVDVGTGSGVIMVSLGYYLKGAKIAGIDLDEGALEVARTNIENYELGGRLKLIRGDLLEPLIRMGKDNVDIVVSNPPYVAREDLDQLPPEVRREPLVALDGGQDGLELYRKLIPQSLEVLRPGGLLALEIGYNQLQAIQSLLEKGLWKRVDPEQDYSGHDRFIFAFKAGEKKE